MSKLVLNAVTVDGIRVRATRRKLIIQIATEKDDDGRPFLEWRDARVEDILMTSLRQADDGGCYE